MFALGYVSTCSCFNLTSLQMVEKAALNNQNFEIHPVKIIINFRLFMKEELSDRLKDTSANTSILISYLQQPYE